MKETRLKHSYCTTAALCIAGSSAEATSSAEPMTYWLNSPVWVNRPGAPRLVAQASSLPKMTCVSGALVNLNRKLSRKTSEATRAIACGM